MNINRDWVKTLTVSLPDYADELGKNIETVMKDHELDEDVAHACALVAALTDGNGELAFEISMSDVLFGNDLREVAAKAVIFESMNTVFTSYSRAITNEMLVVGSEGFSKTDFENFGGSSPEKFFLFCLVSAVVNKSEPSIRNKIRLLQHYGVPQEQVNAAAKIASVIPAISKCLL